jgi:hypothetical protein
MAKRGRGNSALNATIFCFDTSSLVRAWTEAYPLDAFPTFWDRIDELFEDDRIIAPDEVLRETSKRDDGLHKWLKQRSGLFAAIDDELQESVAEVMSDHPFLVKNRPGKNAADPWVIALARTTGSTVVTEEAVNRSAKYPKIPSVCHEYKVPWVRLLDVIRGERWRF